MFFFHADGVASATQTGSEGAHAKCQEEERRKREGGKEEKRRRRRILAK